MQTATPLRSRIEAFGYGSGRGERENVLETTTLELFAAADDVSVGRIGPDVRFPELNKKKLQK